MRSVKLVNLCGEIILFLPFVADVDVELMQNQLPPYLAACDGVRAVDPLKWRADHGEQFPAECCQFLARYC